MAPENVFMLGEERTYTPLDERVGTCAGSPGAATLNLGRNRMKPARIDVKDNDNNVSVMSTGTNYTNMTEPEEYSKEELYEMLREMRMLRRFSKRGCRIIKPQNLRRACRQTAAPAFPHPQSKRKSLCMMRQIADS